MEIVLREDRAVGSLLPRLVPDGADRRDRDAFHVCFDPQSENVVQVIVNAVATIRNVRPNELEPLQHAIDPDALDRLIGSPTTGRSVDLEVTFVYHELEITVHGDGDVWLEWA